MDPKSKLDGQSHNDYHPQMARRHQDQTLQQARSISTSQQGQFGDQARRPPPGFSQHPQFSNWDLYDAQQHQRQQYDPHFPSLPQDLVHLAGGPAPMYQNHGSQIPAAMPQSNPQAQQKIPDFESQMRNMILKNSGSQDQTPETSTQAQSSLPSTTRASPTITRKRLTQAERRQGHSNRLDLSQTPAYSTDSTDQIAAQRSNWRQGHGRGQLSPQSQSGRPAHDNYTSLRSPQGAYHAQTISPTSPRHHNWGPVSPRQHMRGTGSIDHTIHNEAHGIPQTGYASRFNPASPTAPEITNRPRGFGGRKLYEPNTGRASTLPPRQQADYLESLAAQNVPNMGVTIDEERNYAWLQQHLSAIVRTALQSSQESHNVPKESIRLECFGSLASGFGMTNSDMDLMVFYDTTDLTEHQHTSIPRIIEKALLNSGHGARLLTRTRVPIIRFCSDPSKELLEALRLERAKWEEEKDKLPEEAEEVEEAQVQDDEEEDEDAGGDTGENDSLSSENESNPSEQGEVAFPSGTVRDAERKTKRRNVSAVEDLPESPEQSQIAAQNDASVKQVRGSDGDTGGGLSAQDKRHAKKTRKRRKGKNAKGSEDAEKEEKAKEEPGPPPYKNDEERIQMYHQAIKEDWYTAEERELIGKFTTAFEAAQGNPDDDSVIKCRESLSVLPDVLSRYREPRKRKQELEFPEGSGLLCDLNFSTGAHSNPLAVHNTRLQRCYSLFDPRIKQMVIFVKGWAKRRNINKPYHGTLSSYGYVLMVLHYVVNIVHPPLAPNLQLLHERNGFSGYQAVETCDKFDVRFWQDTDAIRMAAVTEYGQNLQSVGSLLAGFFRYYAVHEFRGVKGFEWMKDVLSLRSPGGLMSKQDKGWTGKWTQSTEADDEVVKAREITHRYLLAIEDPFEHDHNVGRPVMHHGIVAIREEFRRANQLIINGGSWNGYPANFFDLGKEHQREHRYFGPNPKWKKLKPPVFGPKNLTGEARRKANEKAAKELEEGSKPLADAVDQPRGKSAGKTPMPATGDGKEEVVVKDASPSKDDEATVGKKKTRARKVRRSKYKIDGENSENRQNIGPTTDSSLSGGVR